MGSGLPGFQQSKVSSDSGFQGLHPASSQPRSPGTCHHSLTGRSNVPSMHPGNFSTLPQTPSLGHSTPTLTHSSTHTHIHQYTLAHMHTHSFTRTLMQGWQISTHPVRQFCPLCEARTPVKSHELHRKKVIPFSTSSFSTAANYIKEFGAGKL